MSEKTKTNKSDKALKIVFGVVLILFIVILVYKCISWFKASYDLDMYVKNANIQQLNDYLYIEEGCSLDEAELTEEFINALPDSFWNDFRNDNGTIYILKNIPIDNVIGRTELKTNTIYIKDGYVFFALAHEFFHYYLHNNPINDFTDIYEEEAKDFIEAYYGEDSEYYYNDEEEYLCQLFQTVFVIGREDKLGVAPKSWNFMVDIIDAM